MRNLKRALSLALASVMVVSMMVVGAGAASYDEFTDKDEIVNKEAVQMLVELGVINGKDTGDFDPTGIVTRAEMAKMICVVLNGGKDPSLGTTVTNTYTDTVGHWASGYIEYCTQLGIVAGDGAGKFNPNATVTGSEAAKMLLVAMGYKSEVEGFTGSNWAIGVNVRANQKGLYSDLSISVDAGLTRDSAAQMVYNALDAGVVSYDYTLVTDGSSITSSPTLIDNNNKTLLEDKFNAVKVEGVVVANEVANLSSTSDKGSALEDGKTSIAITNDDDQSAYAGTKTFAVSTDINDLGRSVVIYVKKDSNSTKAEVLGAAITSADNKVVVDTSKDSIKDVADDNDLTITAETKVAANYGNLVAYSKYTDPKTAGIEKIIIDTDADGDVDYVLMNTYSFGKVTTYTTSGDGSIAVSAGTYALSANDKDDVVGFDDVAKNDYVMAAYIGGDLHVAKADTVVGVLEAYKGVSPATKLTVDGTDYNVSNITNIYTGGEDDIAAAKGYGSANLDNEATFYLDKNGMIVAVGNVSENAYNYALVMAKGSSIDERVKVALPDGTTGTYTLNTSGNGKKLADVEVGTVYAYSINSDKEIKLTAASGGVAKNNATFTKGKTSVGADSMTTVYTNKNTAFYYTADAATVDADDGVISEVNVYTGYNNAPSLKSGSGAQVEVYTSGTRVVAVVFTGSDLTTANVSDNLYLYSVGTSTSNYTNGKAFIAGDTKPVDIKMDSKYATGIYTYTINSDGYYELTAMSDVGSDYDDYAALDSNDKPQFTVKTATSDSFIIGTDEFSVTSKTLLVDNSDYLDDPIAELGAGPDEGDKIAYVVYTVDDNKNPDEALLVVVMNPETGNSSGGSTSEGDFDGTNRVAVNTRTGVVTVDWYKSITAGEIRSLIMEATDAYTTVSVKGDSSTGFTVTANDGFGEVELTVKATEYVKVNDNYVVKGSDVDMSKGEGTYYKQNVNGTITFVEKSTAYAANADATLTAGYVQVKVNNLSVGPTRGLTVALTGISNAEQPTVPVAGEYYVKADAINVVATYTINGTETNDSTGSKVTLDSTNLKGFALKEGATSGVSLDESNSNIVKVADNTTTDSAKDIVTATVVVAKANVTVADAEIAQAD